MSAPATSLPLTSSSPPLALAPVPRARCSGRRVALACAGGFAVYLMHILLQPVAWLQEYGQVVRDGLATPWRPLVSDEIGALLLLAAIALVDQAPAGARRRSTYVLAAVGACAAWAAIHFALLRLAHVDLDWGPIPDGDPWHSIRIWYGFFEWSMLAVAATLFVIDLRRADGAQRWLRDAQRERALAARRTLEAQLQAMQARVEPRFLFRSLERVRALYGHRPEHAEALLDDMIAYLQSAMPHMRSTRSTVGQEIALLRAYLAILGGHHEAGARLTMRVEEALHPWRLPAMMLLPLVVELLGDLPEDARDHGVLVECHALPHRGLRLRVEVTRSLPTRQDDAVATAVRERLAALYGGRARLVASVGAGVRREVTIELPPEDDDAQGEAARAREREGSARV